MATGMASSLSLGEGGVSGLRQRLHYIILIQDFRRLPLVEHLRELACRLRCPSLPLAR